MQTQQPKRESPQLGVEVSTTNGHSLSAVAPRYMANKSLLFQKPLSIGKTCNLRTRVSNHLRVDSVLRKRLKDAEHDLEQCRLLLIGCSENISCSALEVSEDEDENNSEFSQLESEILIEDILSRLFLPSFTIKYG